MTLAVPVRPPTWMDCSRCTHGIVERPPYDATGPMLNIPGHLHAMQAAGELRLCDCKSGELLRSYLAGEGWSQAKQMELDRRQAAERRQQAIFEQAEIPPNYRQYTLKSFIEAFGQDSGKARALEVIKKFLNDELTRKGLLFHGESGVGKTGLLSPVFLRLLGSGNTGLWIAYQDLLESLKDWDNNSERKFLCKCVDVLFLDDLGNPDRQTPTDWQQEQIWEIVYHRDGYDLTTIVTTNLYPQQIELQFGNRTWRRLQRMCTVVKMAGNRL